jgi:hypothetical protein
VTSNDIVLRFLKVFDEVGVQYMLVGSYSSNFYGRPRSTKDADFVLQLQGDSISAICSKLGSGFKLDPQMSFETVTSTMRYIVTHINSVFKIALFLLSNDPHDRLRFQRRQKEDFEGHEVWLPTAEDVVVTKLRWSKGGRRKKDVDDVTDVLKVRHSRLDLAYIRHWTDQHGTRELFEQLLAKAAQIAPPDRGEVC